MAHRISPPAALPAGPARPVCRGHACERGLSTIELITVTALVLILVALLLPAVRQIRERTKTMQCMSRLQQIGTGMMLYASENGHLPHSSHFEYWADWGESIIPYMELISNRFIPGESWAYGLWQLNDGSHQHLDHAMGQGVKNPATGEVYTPGYSFFTCPAGPVSTASATYKGQTGIHIHGHSYSCNEYLMPSNNWRNWLPGSPTFSDGASTLAGGSVIFPPVKPQELERPGSLILVCDSGASVGSGTPGAIDTESFDTLPNAINPIILDFTNNPDTASTRGADAVTTPSASDNDLGTGEGWPVYYRHQGRCVTLMADGHVQLFSNGEMQRRNFVSRGRTKQWGGGAGFIEAYYP